MTAYFFIQNCFKCGFMTVLLRLATHE